VIGKIPTVFKMKIQINHAKWLFLPAFHKAIAFINKYNLRIVARIMAKPFFLVTAHAREFFRNRKIRFRVIHILLF